MKRVLTVVACVLVVGVVVGAVALALRSDGPSAYSVGNDSFSQQSVDEELRALADNEALDAAIRQSGGEPLATFPGSIASGTAAGWVGLRVALTGAAQAVERGELDATEDDRDRGKQLAAESVGGQSVFSTLPSWFRDRLVARWTNVAILEREVVADPTPALEAKVAALCPSGRYVSHILVDTETQAAAIKQELERGGDFAEVAASTSKDGSAADGGRLGCLDGQSFVEPFATVATNQPVGVVSDPVQTEFGYHLILVTDQPSAADVERVALEEILGRVARRQVEVDPRYGTWDRRNGQVVPPVVPGTLSAPAAAPGG